SYHSRLWEPLMLLHARFVTKKRMLPQNWLSSQDIANLLHLADFDVIKREWRIFSPVRLFGIGRLINRFIATLPLIRKLCSRNYVVARPRPQVWTAAPSTTVVVPCRNERGNIESAITRTPTLSDDLEFIFIEGGSIDGTWDEIQRVI